MVVIKYQIANKPLKNAMENVNNKNQSKTSIIRIMQVLENYSDEKHPLQQQEIIDYLEKDYCIQMERKAVGYNIGLLVEMFNDDDSPIKVVSKRKVGTWIEKRYFEDNEIRFLIDLVRSNYSFSPRILSELCKKILSMASFNYRNPDDSQKKPDKSLREEDMAQSDDTEDFALATERFGFGDLDTKDIIENAIQLKRKCQFLYCIQGRGGVEFVWTPLYVGMRSGRYYVLFYAEDQTCRWIRLDYIEDADISTEEAESIDLGRLIECVHVMQWNDPDIEDENSIYMHIFVIDNQITKLNLVDALGTDFEIECAKRKSDFRVVRAKCVDDQANAFVDENWAHVLMVEPNDDGMQNNRMKRWYKKNFAQDEDPSVVRTDRDDSDSDN